MRDTPLKVTVISDYICPWCYIGAKRVAEFERQFEVEVTWWPFELHPETPREGRDISAMVDRRGQEYRDHLRAYAAEAGITLASNRRLSNSHRALELSEFARDRGAFRPVHDALFRAYFEEGRDIGDMDVLCDLAAEAGLDPAEFKVEALVGRYAALIDETTAIARQKGTASTPTMIFDDRMVMTGAQDPNVYADLLTRLGANLRHPGII
jgi:predicted DsbA family dithiol-disulfide isomerase